MYRSSTKDTAAELGARRARSAGELGRGPSGGECVCVPLRSGAGDRGIGGRASGRAAVPPGPALAGPAGAALMAKGAQSGTICGELSQQAKLALPATLTYLLGRSLVSIGLVFIGRLGELQLAAAALANTTTNVSGLSIVVGMGTACSTICGQAFGAGNYDKVGKTLRLALAVFWAACVPISVSWWYSDRILLVSRRPNHPLPPTFLRGHHAASC